MQQTNQHTKEAPETDPESRSAPSLVVFSGGTAFNTVAPLLSRCASHPIFQPPQANLMPTPPSCRLTTRVTHVLPVSDDGGSTAEIVRVLGGPAVGDIRSRCIRCVPFLPLGDTWMEQPNLLELTTPGLLPGWRTKRTWRRER